MSRNGNEFFGNIVSVRAVEDSIRATKKYTEGIHTIHLKHPTQGSFPSKAFWKYYEVYPDMEVGLDMPVGKGFELITGFTLCIDVLFRYDYRDNKASVRIKGGDVSLHKLSKTIPNFRATLEKVMANGAGQ